MIDCESDGIEIVFSSPVYILSLRTSAFTIITIFTIIEILSLLTSAPHALTHSKPKQTNAFVQISVLNEEEEGEEKTSHRKTEPIGAQMCWNFRNQ